MRDSIPFGSVVLKGRPAVSQLQVLRRTVSERAGSEDGRVQEPAALVPTLTSAVVRSAASQYIAAQLMRALDLMPSVGWTADRPYGPRAMEALAAVGENHIPGSVVDGFH